MPHQDQGRSTALSVSHSLEHLQSALAWLVEPQTFGRWKFRKDCSWTPVSLAWTVIVWTWSESAGLGERFFAARQLISDVAMDQRQLAGSYQAFVKMLRRHTPLLLFAMGQALQRRMQQSLSACYHTAGYVVFGVDGTRIGVPRTRANELRLGAIYRGSRGRRRRGRRRQAAEQKARSPQAWLTTLWHVGSGLPWCWQHGPTNSSEREHLAQLLATLPSKALLTADAGYVGYTLWQSLLTAGIPFVIRVGSHVRLLKRLGYTREHRQSVYLWPDAAARRREPPLVLRLVVVHTGRHPMYLVTSVLSSRELSDRQLVELYRARWGVELFYRSFKQTFARRKLLAHAPENVSWELDWSLVGLWAACLYARCIQAERGVAHRPLSVAGVLRYFRRAMAGRIRHSTAGTDLLDLLAGALVDDYLRRRPKHRRNFPVKKADPPGISPPTIQPANPRQILLAQELSLPIRFTA